MQRLLDILFPPRTHEALLRGAVEDDLLRLLAPRIIPVTRPATTALLPYKEPIVRAAIHEAKYHGNRQAHRLLARALTEYLQDADQIDSPTHLIPIPLGTARRKERGFNQVELLIHHAHSLSDLGANLDTDLLFRKRETRSQVSLPRHERETNMRGAFGTIRDANPSHLYIVVDDVVTTGATLQAAIDALRDAGAKHIVPLALAH